MVREFIGHRIVLYRPKVILGIAEGHVHYGVGPLRAKVFGIRIPTLWAVDQLIFVHRYLAAARGVERG